MQNYKHKQHIFQTLLAIEQSAAGYATSLSGGLIKTLVKKAESVLGKAEEWQKLAKQVEEMKKIGLEVDNLAKQPGISKSYKKYYEEAQKTYKSTKINVGQFMRYFSKTRNMKFEAEELPESTKKFLKAA